MNKEISYEKAEDKSPIEVAPQVAASTKTHNLFWSGGFDSTAIMLQHLKRGDIVHPYYMIHSTGWEKCKQEIAAQENIREFLGNPVALLPTQFWHYDQFHLTPGMKKLSNTLDELAASLNISRQYSALRFCRDATDFQGTLQIGVVRYDELHTCWSRLDGANTLKTFFTGFEFPAWDKMKRDLWDEMPPLYREVLKKTFSCEKSDGEKRSCLQRKVEFKDQCLPCQHRIPEVG
jgi:hypothetical protein